MDTLRTELVDTLSLAHKHNFKFLTVGVVVDILGDALIDRIVLDGDVDGDPRLQVDNVIPQSFNLIL